MLLTIVNGLRFYNFGGVSYLLIVVILLESRRHICRMVCKLANATKFIVLKMISLFVRLRRWTSSSFQENLCRYCQQ